MNGGPYEDSKRSYLDSSYFEDDSIYPKSNFISFGYIREASIPAFNLSGTFAVVGSYADETLIIINKLIRGFPSQSYG